MDTRVMEDALMSDGLESWSRDRKLNMGKEAS